MRQHIPLVICGAGPVGQALALMLQQRGMNAQDIVLFDAKSKEQAANDARTIALSYGSQQLLTRLQASVLKATAIQEIHVSRSAYFGRCLMKASQYQLPALGYVARYADIIAPLEAAIARANIRIERPASITQIQEEGSTVQLQLTNGETITSDLVIQAEGGTFDQQVQGHVHQDYQQTAIISHVTCSHAKTQRAFERFTNEGPLALLPQEHGYSLVWCVQTATAEQLINKTQAEFLHALQSSFGQRVGRFLSASQRIAFPLGLNTYAQTQQRCIKIGNASQTLHPVAGQGLNLGLRDACVLAKCIANIDLHNTQSLEQATQQFTQQRQTDRQRSVQLTGKMATVFTSTSTSNNSIEQTLLGIGLSALDIITPLKKQLAEQMIFGIRE